MNLDVYALVHEVFPTVNVYCPPKQGISTEAAIDALVSWLQRNPTKHQLPARTALFFALKTKYPCD
jgi:hypothetical protein